MSFFVDHDNYLTSRRIIEMNWARVQDKIQCERGTINVEANVDNGDANNIKSGEELQLSY